MAERVDPVKIINLVNQATDTSYGGVPGIVFECIDRTGKVLATATSGVRSLDDSQPMSLDTTFWIASCTKLITSIACMQLVERGTVHLDDPHLIDKFLPEVAAATVLNRTEEKRREGVITLRMLLTHTSGYSYTFLWEDWWNRIGRDKNRDEFQGSFEAFKQSLKFQPDKIGIDWVGVLIARVTKMTLGEYFEENIFSPLGTTSSAIIPSASIRSRMGAMHSRDSSGKFHVTEHLNRIAFDPSSETGYFESGGAGLFSTTSDYCQILAAILNGGVSPSNGNRILQCSTIDQMFQNQVKGWQTRYASAGFAICRPELAALSLREGQLVTEKQGWGMSFLLSGDHLEVASASEAMTPSLDQQSPLTQATGEPYKVANITLFDPSMLRYPCHMKGGMGFNTTEKTNFVGLKENKKIKICMIGAGVSGIMMAYKIQKVKSIVDLLFDTYSFALNPDWPSFFSPSKDIWAYLNRVVDKWGLRKYMRFSTEVIGCVWQEETSTWKVQMRRSDDGKNVTEFNEECDILLHATGVLNNFKWPSIKGIEKFKGKLIHTARWPEQYQEQEWSKEKVVIIGSGASSIQTVPNMQPYVKHMDIFIRTPVWFVDIAGNEGKNISYTDEQKSKFRSDPSSLVAHAKWLEDQVNGGWAMMLKGTPEQLEAQKKYSERTSGIIKNERLLKNLIPKWSVGCRRITPGDPYMIAIQQPNVDVHFEEVVEITGQTIIGKMGTERTIDTIVCATAVPEMPNFFTFIGPSWPIGNGSVMGPLEAVGDYVIQFLQKMQNELIMSFEPRQDITDLFNEHVQEYMKGTVWTDDCRSWYKDPQTNRVNAIWPGASLHYIESIRQPRYEDFTIKYSNKNPWTYLGRGYSLATTVPDGDKSPYISITAIDENWLSDSTRVMSEKTNGKVEIASEHI
ncbi:hypothetical protein B7463_g3052, partial [Scytalidium lignicola]